MSLEDLIVKPANEAQIEEATRRDAVYWAGRFGMSVEDYIKVDELFLHASFARDGRLKVWVLVPEEDPETVNFYASCETLTREVLTLQPGQTYPSTSHGHGITSVLVPPEHRGKGYANRLMSLMHFALAPHRYTNSLKVPTTIENPSTVSVLYSIVGDYYARCAPMANQSGWTIQQSFTTTWSLASIQTPPTSPLPVELLSEPEVAMILNSDESNVADDLLKLQRQDPTKTYFAFVPAAPLNDYSVIIGKLAIEGRGLTNVSWGARVLGTNDFMTWVFYGVENIKLIVTRLRATTDSFPALLGAAFQIAKVVKCETMETWNIPDDIKTVAQESGGETSERMDDLAAFKWYGQEPDSKADNADIFWALEER
ncbi:unnamed protein product [Rhizoctonia solani]|uniref:LYC1 C-terminal domain-containing protein n=1 Tax=Rhizoctonia solani TaxID=456999 RepID=A0A8H3ALK1_9AGAM|nr:unnamed protein product [Rhizoctonia solani]